MTQKAAAPKKETARITLPPEGGKTGGMPKATIKMQQTQPLVSRPAPTISTAQITPATTAVAAAAATDGAANMLSIVALVISLLALATVFMAYSATSL
jgi:hypothetical protein